MTAHILLTGVATLGLVGQAFAQSVEIAPTRDLVAKVEMLPEVKEISNPEFYFRRFGPHVLWCVYATGGNGHFCSKITSKQATETDKRVTICANPIQTASCLTHRTVNCGI